MLTFVGAHADTDKVESLNKKIQEILDKVIKNRCELTAMQEHMVNIRADNVDLMACIKRLTAERERLNKLHEGEIDLFSTVRPITRKSFP